MTLIISHNSALEWMRYCPPTIVGHSRFGEKIDMEQCPVSEDALDRLSSVSQLLQKPIHVSVSKDRFRPKRKSIDAHVLTKKTLNENILYSLGDGIFVAGPELCFLQMAQNLSKLGLIVLGFELCGYYSQYASLISGFYERNPLSSTTQLVDLLGSFHGLRGAKRAHDALQWVLDGSASPMETVEACRLMLPNSMGGEGFIQPKLNFEVALDTVASSITGTKSCRIDLAWPDIKVGGEYDGAEYHGDQCADRRRREALAHLGWSVFVADSSHIHKAGMHTDLVSLLEGRVKRRPGQEKVSAIKADELLSRLLSATRYGFGKSRALFAPEVAGRRLGMH